MSPRLILCGENPKEKRSTKAELWANHVFNLSHDHGALMVRSNKGKHSQHFIIISHYPHFTMNWCKAHSKLWYCVIAVCENDIFTIFLKHSTILNQFWIVQYLPLLCLVYTGDPIFLVASGLIDQQAEAKYTSGIAYKITNVIYELNKIDMDTQKLKSSGSCGVGIIASAWQSSASRLLSVHKISHYELQECIVKMLQEERRYPSSELCNSK